MKILSLIALCVLLQGCVYPRYTRTTWTTNGGFERVTFSIPALLANENVTKLSVDRVMSKTKSGVTLGAAQTQIDDEALHNVTEAIVEGVVKGIK